MNNRPRFDEPHLVHGTYDGYHNHGCRCIPCTRAFSVKHREKMARRAARVKCEIEGCTLGLYALGVCKPHYERRRRGRPDYPLPIPRKGRGRYPNKDRVK